MSDVPFALSTLTPPIRVMLWATGSCLLAGLAIAFFGIWPAHQRLKALQTEVAGLAANQAGMQRDIAGAPTQQRATDAAEAERDAVLAEGVIEPLLGSFAMRGKTLVDPLAAEAGFVISNVREDRFIPLQVPAPPPRQLYGRQLVEFSGLGAYTQIVAFVHAVEQTFPLAILSGFKIESQMQTPERHRATITFEWPVKGETRP